MSSEKVSFKRFLTKGPGDGDLQNSLDSYFPGFQVRAIENIDELQTCAQLVYNEYTEAGYMRPNLSKTKLSLHLLLPTTKTFVVVADKQIVATLTLVGDSPLGLPMESLFHTELTALRLDGRRLVEFSMLALNHKYFSENYPTSSSMRVVLLCHLFRGMFDYIRMKTNIDTMLECCHPTHDGFYDKLMSLELLGTARPSGNVNGNLAIARFLDIPRALQLGPTQHGACRLLLRGLPDECEWDRDLRLNENNINHLFVHKSNLLHSATPEKLAFIKKCLPHVDFDRLLRSRDVFSYLLESLDQRSYFDHKTVQS